MSSSQLAARYRRRNLCRAFEKTGGTPTTALAQTQHWHAQSAAWGEELLVFIDDERDVEMTGVAR